MNLIALLGALVLLILNGFFVGAEFALVAARRANIEAFARKGDRRAVVALQSLRELSLMLAGAQLGITMASLGLGALAEPAVAHLFEKALDSTALPAGLSHSLAFAIALTIVVFLHMVIGEMAPKNIAIALPEKTVLRVAIPFRFFMIVLKPFIHVMNNAANAGVRLFGIEPQDELTEVHSVEDIQALVARSAGEGLLDETERRLLTGASTFSEKDAAAIMVPRTAMAAFSVSTTPAEIEELVVRTGHSRFPVYKEDLDDVIGFFHSKDLLRVVANQRRKPLSKRWIRPMLNVPESRKLHPLMIDMRREHQHFALVVDEHGGTAGIVSLEDVLEELVGDIHDEFDTPKPFVEELGEGRYVVPGTLSLHDVEELGLELPDGDYETLAGFLMDRLGRIPKRRDIVDYDGWRLRVISMQRRRVLKVVVEKISDA